jgi:hypothetical protein
MKTLALGAALLGACATDAAPDEPTADPAIEDGKADATVVCQPGAPPPWSIKVVRWTGNATQPALAIDATGRLHASFFDLDTLYYASRTTRWRTEVVDAAIPFESDDSPPEAIAVDAAGGVHIAYEAGHAIRYAHKAPGGTFVTETIEDNLNLLAGPSVALGAGGEVHVAYGTFDLDTAYVRHAARAPGGGWTLGTIGTDASDVSLAVDGQGAWHALDRGYLEPGSHPLPVGGANAMAVDPANGIHVVAEDGDVDHAVLLPGGTWSSVATLDHSSIGQGFDSRVRPAIAVDGSGGVHIAYQIGVDHPNVGTDWKLRYGHQPPVGTLTTREVTGAFARASALAVDRAGHPNLLYWDDSKGGYRLATLAACP